MLLAKQYGAEFYKVIVYSNYLCFGSRVVCFTKVGVRMSYFAWLPLSWGDKGRSNL